MRNKLLIFFLITIVSDFLFCKESGRIVKTYSARHFVANDGLPQMQISSLYTDSKGFVWIGTRYTFAKWDGKELKSFNSKLKESYEFVEFFYELPNNKILVFFRPIYNSELKFVMVNGASIKHFKLVGEVFNQIEKFYCTNIDEENIQLSILKDGFLYVFKYNLFKNKLILKKKISNVNCILNCSRGNIFYSNISFSDTSSFYLYNDKNNSIRKTTLKRIDSNSILALSQRNKKQTISFVDIDKNQLFFYYSDNNDLYCVLQKVPFKLKNDVRYKVNSDGLMFYDNNITYLYDFNQKHSIDNLPIPYCFKKDASNNFFIGTDIGLYNFYKFGISEIKLNINPDFDNIWSMTRDLKGGYFFSSFTNGIYYSKDGINFSKIHIPNAGDIGGFGTICNKNNDVLLPLSVNGKVPFLINGKLKVFDFQNGNEIYASVLDPFSQDIYITNLKSIYKFDNKLKKLLKFNSSLDTLYLRNIISLSFSKDRNLIVKTTNESYIVGMNGDYKINTKLNKLGYSICCDKYNTIWESYSSSLYCSKNGIISKLNKLKVSTSILSLIEYEKWLVIGTFREIIFFDLEKWHKNKEEKYIIYSINNEIDVLEGGQNNFYIDLKDSIIYWPCLDKILRIEPKILTNVNNLPPRVSIDEYILYKNNQKISIIDSIGQDKLKLGKDIRNIDILFSSPKYEHKSFLNYRYRLNKNEPWQSNQNSQNIRLVDLIPGIYNVEIQTSFDEKNWSESEISLPIVIQSKFYETGFFWIFFIVILFSISSMIAIFLLEKQKIKHRQEVKKQVDKNNLQLQVIKSKYIPHFTFNAITSINYLLRKKEIRKASSYLVKMTELQRIALTNFENSEIPLETELKFLENYLSLESLRFEDKLKYNINISPNMDMQILVPNLSIHTMVENAIKHGLYNKEEENWKLNVYILYRNNKLILSVEDNGIGINDLAQFETNFTGTGLSMLEKQLEILNTDNIKYTFKLSTMYLPNKKIRGARSCIIIEYLDKLSEV